MVAIEQKYVGSRDGKPMYRSVIISDNTPSALPTDGGDVDGMTEDAVFAPGSLLIVVNEDAYYLAGEAGTFVLQE